MTAGDDSLFVTVGGRDVGLEALLKKVDAEMQVSADRAVRLGQQYARLAQAQGQPTTASQILAGTMQRAGAASEQSLIGISTQAARLTTSSQGLGSAISGLGGQLSQLGGTAGSLAGSIGNLAGSFGTLGTVGAAVGLGKIAVDLSVAGANADLVRQRFDGLAESAGTTGDALLNALRAASGGEINDLNLTLAANKAQLLGVADSAEEFSVLMGIARDRAQQMGISTTQAFNDLTTGLGRGSALILDNLGIIVSVKEANEQYAASIGKTAAALTEAEQKQALINQVLAQGRASLQASGGAVQSTAGTFAQFNANLANATNGIGSFLSGGLAPLANQFNQTATATGQFVTFLQGIPGALFPTAEAASASAAALAAFDAEMQRSGDTTRAEIAYQAALAEAHRQAAASAAQAAAAQAAYVASIDEDRQAVAAAAAIAQQAQAAQIGYADSLAMTGVQARAAAQASEQKANADQVASVDAQTHAVAQQQLAQQAQAAAQALLAAGPAGARTAAILAGSSQQVDILTAAYYRLASAQAASVPRSTAIGQGIAQTTLRLEAQGDAYKKIRDAKEQQIILTGTEAEKQRVLQTQLERARVTYGQNSKAYIDAQTKMLQAQQGAAKSKGGGGGTRLSDQQKLNNQLLADQDKANDQFEDAEAAHQERLLKIQLDYAQKTLAQQKQNEVSKRRSMESFYDQLTSSELNKSKAGTDALRAIDAQYQADYQKAQELAQAGKAKQSADLLALARQQASDEIEYQEKLAKAQEAKDKAEVSRLEAIHKLHQDTANEERKQVLEGGDANLNERDKALADEQAQYEAQQDKIGTAAERAAERQETAALRAGKAIDAVNTKLGVTKSTYDQIAPTAGGSAPATATNTSSGAGVAATGVAGVPGGADAVVVAIADLKPLLAAIERATSASGDKVASALKVRIAA